MLRSRPHRYQATAPRPVGQSTWGSDQLALSPLHGVPLLNLRPSLRDHAGRHNRVLLGALAAATLAASVTAAVANAIAATAAAAASVDIFAEGLEAVEGRADSRGCHLIAATGFGQPFHGSDTAHH